MRALTTVEEFLQLSHQDIVRRELHGRPFGSGVLVSS